LLRFGRMLGTLATSVLLLRPTFLALLFAVGACLGQLGGKGAEREAPGRNREAEVGAREKGRSSARVLLVDDHPFMRVAMRDALTADRDLAVVGEANDGHEAVVCCRELEPDLVLMDVSMPGMDGIEATRRIKEEFPKTSVLVLTAHADQGFLMEAVKAGAAGYVLKENYPERVLGSVRAVLEGDTPLDQGLAMRLLRRLGEEEASAPSATTEEAASASPSNPLTPREMEVLTLLASGRANRQIAKELHLSLSTVKRHLEHIMSKLKVSDRTQAVVKAIEMGLLAPKRL
jgi:DNA-binding NarL/FixJ family response regulator